MNKDEVVKKVTELLKQEDLVKIVEEGYDPYNNNPYGYCHDDHYEWSKLPL